MPRLRIAHFSDVHFTLDPFAHPRESLHGKRLASFFSYLVGGRFMELKTVQIMDTLEIDKPCIDARDEAYNVEWSTEFTLEKAWDEYAKAWIILHLLEALMHKGKFEKPSFIFNMSVGYDLAGIKTERMQQFIDSMFDARKDERFDEYLAELDALAGIALREVEGRFQSREFLL